MSSPLLLMELGRALYALDAASVREIVPAAWRVTRLPGAPSHVRGIINLRGHLVTVVDLALRLTGTPVRNPEGSTIVVQSGQHMLGLTVDDVRDVQSLDLSTADGLPYQSTADSPIRGLGRLGDEVVIVVDVDEIIRQTLG